MTNRLSRGAITCALFATTSIVGLVSEPARAQQAQPQKFRQLDANGVDLTWGDFVMNFTEGSIGSGESQLALVRNAQWRDGAYDANSNNLNWDRIWLSQTLSGGNPTVTNVMIGPRFEQFSPTGSLPSGSSLSGSGSSYVYRTADGTVINFGDPTGGYQTSSQYCNGSAQTQCILLPVSITSPDGKTVTIEWEAEPYWTGGYDEELNQLWSYDTRITQVSNSFGYRVAFTYASNATSGTAPAAAAWHKRTSASFYNDNVSTTTVQSTVSYAYPSAGVTEVTDPAGRVWRFTGTADRVTGIRRPGASSDTTSVSYNPTTLLVSGVTQDGVATTYSRSVVGTTATMTVTNALSQQTVVTSNLGTGRPTSIKDGLNRTTSYQYDTYGLLSRVTAPEGNYTQYGRDSRGNVTSTTSVAKAGSGLSNIVTSASFDATCTNPVKCNKPNSTTDARGHVTDYTYDSTHGGVLTITRPAPTTGAVRPQTRYSYTLTNGEYRLTGVSECQTTSSCSGGADEVKSTTTYDASGNVISTSSGNGSGTLTATNAMTYDPRGNLLTVDGPLSGTADTTAFKYDSANQQTGVISPDPDGAGSLPNRATRLTYRSDGQVSKRELGTTAGQSDANFNAMTVAQTVDITFDSNNRPVTSKLSASGTNYALTQTSYDALGRVDCTAVRMNTAIYGSLPSSACSLGTQGSFGPDRISQKVYDAAGELTQLIVAKGVTGQEATERTLTYSNNGMLATFKDAENNLTTYEYDGFDRLSKTRFPVSTKGANSSSTTDYEQLSYDANSNVTSRRLRDANSIAFTFDNLDRVTAKDLPGSEPDVAYGYDNLGRLTSASQTGNALSFTYDALGRELTEVGPEGTATSEYDLAGRRTKLTYPGSGLYVNRDYLVTGEASAIRENGASSGVGVLASYGYDNLGNRTSVNFGNGVAQAYTFDAVSRLASLTNDLSGTSNDLSATFAYSPASQISSSVRTGDAYAFTGHANATTAYAQNGLNQQITIGGSSASWDSKGNLTSDPVSGKTYGYSSENLLTSASGSVTLAYDPALRLYQVAGGSTTRFAYDGANAIAEYDGSNALQRRFVFGPGVDAPIVQYEGSGTSNRKFLSSDERGSIIAATDSSGTLLSVNSYDEYGKPAAGNSGRFQYTGQMWLGEIGAYHYKARVYLPQLGIFAQTDPMGGTNLYAAMGGDPINLLDPSGMEVKENNGPSEPSGTAQCSGSRIPGSCGSHSGFSFGGPGGFGASAAIGAADAAALANEWAGAHGITDAGTIQAATDYLMYRGGLGQVAATLSNSDNGLFYRASVLGDALEIGSNLRDLRAAGIAGEQAVLQSLTSDGYRLIGVQVYVRTPLGLRITDLLMESPWKTLEGFEVKTGFNFSYGNNLQMQKDSYIGYYGGTIVGYQPLGSFNGVSLGRGSLVRYPTTWVYVNDLGD